MAHSEQRHFFDKVRVLYPDSFKNKKVLECGSLNVNGTFRTLFTNCDYLGVDIVPGNGVDMVCKAHEVPFPNGTFDTVVSGEMLEHDEYWRASLKKMYDVLRAGGLLVISCAGEGRPEHGTSRTGSHWGTSNDYYKNLTPKDIQEVYKKEMFSEVYYEENTTSHDTYFYGKL